MDKVYLQITCWEGISLGAEHYYGHLCGYRNGDRNCYDKIELTKRLSAKEAERLNRKDRCEIDLYFEGEESERFNSEHEVIQKAIEVWQEHFPGARLLLCGSSCSADPARILVAPEPFFSEGNRLFEEAKKIGFWDFHEEKMGAISEAWSELIRRKQ